MRARNPQNRVCGPGHIALHMHMSNTWCEYKDIKIKDLSPEMQK